MANKLFGLLVTALMAGATAFASTGGLIGERYAAFDLGYSEYGHGGHVRGSGINLNVPSSIRGLDLGFDVGYFRGDFGDVVKTRNWAVSVNATEHWDFKGIKPYISGSIGYTQAPSPLLYLDPIIYGPDHSVEVVRIRKVWSLDPSLAYTLGTGVELPVTPKTSITVGFNYSNFFGPDHEDSFSSSVGVNYWVTTKVALRSSYRRNFDANSNAFTLGVAVRY